MTTLTRLMLLTVLLLALGIIYRPHLVLETYPDNPKWDVWVSAGPDDGMYPRSLHLYIDAGGYYYLRLHPLGEQRGCLPLAPDSCQWPRG